jgi:hypothetical protein
MTYLSIKVNLKNSDCCVPHFHVQDKGGIVRNAQLFEDAGTIGADRL